MWRLKLTCLSYLHHPVEDLNHMGEPYVSRIQGPSDEAEQKERDHHMHASFWKWSLLNRVFISEKDFLIKNPASLSRHKCHDER